MTTTSDEPRWIVGMGFQAIQRGDHLWVRRTGYSHHGIYCGDGTVIHFSGDPGSKKRACIFRSDLDSFSIGETIQVVEYGERFGPNETVRRAESRLGESGYSLFGNNCEHFATWCCTGKHQSDQVVGVATGTAVSIAAPGAAMGTIALLSSAGAVAGMSGPGIMTALSTAGGLVGGGAAAGPVVIAALPAVAASGVMHYALRPSESHNDVERKSRRDGRNASKVAAGATLAGTPVVISAAGTTAGLSAAGISSGLAAIGATVGGGMAAGVAVTVAAPVVAAGAIGAAAYFGGKALRRRSHTKRLA